MALSDYCVYRSANHNPRIKIHLVLDSAKGGLLKNIQNNFSRHLGSREIAKTQVHIFFLKHRVPDTYFLTDMCYLLYISQDTSYQLIVTWYLLTDILTVICYLLLDTW